MNRPFSLLRNVLLTAALTTSFAFAQSQTVRDPFLFNTAPTTSKVIKVAPKNASAAPVSKKPAAQARPAQNVKVVQIPRVEAPKLTVQGIISSRTGNKAILTSDKGNTYVVTQGQKLGDYRVASVTSGKVVMKYKDQAFPLKLHK